MGKTRTEMLKAFTERYFFNTIFASALSINNLSVLAYECYGSTVTITRRNEVNAGTPRLLTSRMM